MIKLYFATEDALVVLTTAGGQPRCDFLLKGSNIGCVTVDPLRPQFIAAHSVQASGAATTPERAGGRPGKVFGTRKFSP